MFWKEHGEKIKSHLTAFYEQYEYFKRDEPELMLHDYADSYIKNEVSMEEGMQSYIEGVQQTAKYNLRILKAIKKVKGRTFHKHLVNLMKDSQAVDWDNWEIISEPTGDHQKEDEYGKSIKQVWVDQWATGTEGDSFDGYICVLIKPKKYLKFRFSC